MNKLSKDVSQAAFQTISPLHIKYTEEVNAFFSSASLHLNSLAFVA